jgi:hypothetical protein
LPATPACKWSAQLDLDRAKGGRDGGPKGRDSEAGSMRSTTARPAGAALLLAELLPVGIRVVVF